MRFVFFGTPEFAEIVLKKMVEGGCVPDLVICNPDRPAGRKKTITPPLTKLFAKEYKIKTWQPEKLVYKEFDDQVDGIDFAVVAAYAKIIPQNIVDFPKLGTIGVHPSLLPKYRGSSPIQSVLLSGEHETGVTLYLMDEKLDHGPILAQRKTIIGDHEDYSHLEKRLAELGGALLAETLPDFYAGKIKPMVQDEDRATSTKKFLTQDAFVDSRDLIEAESENMEKAIKINRMIRAFVVEPGAWTMQDGKRVKLLASEVTASGLKLKKTQIEGEKPKLLN
ncbi:MAG: methionyl-tRNA formyltransferase [Patescibacteria group bacterium]